MPGGRHRAEPVNRSLPLRRRQVVRVATGTGAALATTAVILVTWSHVGSGPDHPAVATLEGRRGDAALVAGALQAAPGPGAAPKAAPQGTTSAAASPSATPTGSAPAVVTRATATPTSTPRPTSTTRPASTSKAATTTSKSVPSGVSSAPCSISSDIETHLTSNARAVYRAVCAAFGTTVSSFGGYRAGDDGDHGSGRAVDIMVSGDPGWTIARYVQAHARELHVTYVIYQQHIWLVGNPTTQWKAMEDRGSRTANHFDHVHVSVS